MRDPYQVLGISRSAGEAEIKKAYRQLAKTYHPDRNANDPKAKDRFAEVNSAYEILGDEKKRAQFDRGEIDADGKPRFQGFEGFGGGRRPGGRGEGGFEGFNFGFGGGRGGRGGGAGGIGEDLFSIFGEAFRGGGAGERPGRGGAAARGDDLAATLTVSLEDIANEAKKRITLPTGREVDVVVPKGVADGQAIRLKGLGAVSPFGGEPGDVHLTIHIAPHEHFTIEGADLRVQVPVLLEDAVLGGTARVPTLSGAVEMKVPPMTSSGRVLRLRGKGLPRKDGTRGDLLAAVAIKLPEEADEELLAFARRRKAASAV
jgi:DnaJ-class molecular chaperone